MSMRSIFRARKFMTNKSFVFFTLVLSLSIMGKAYSGSTYIDIINKIPPGQITYSKEGFTVEADGSGSCMRGTDPHAYTATYTTTSEGVRINIHFKSSGSCAVKSSAQNFKVINKSTGEVEGRFAWKKLAGDVPYIKMLQNPDGFMVDISHQGFDIEPNALNIRAG